MKALTALRRIAKEKAPGPPSTFTELHLAKAVEIIGEKAMGRAGLARALNLGEGATRTLIGRLTDGGLVISTRRGIWLARSGLSILKELQRSFPRGATVPKSSITVGLHNFGVLVRNGADRVRSGIEQRDAAVRAGAIGAVTVLFKNGRLYMPPVREFAVKGWKEIARTIMEIFNPKDSDAIVICGAESMQQAEEGARAAAWTLVNQGSPKNR